MSWSLAAGLFALALVCGLAATRLVLGYASRCLLDIPCGRSSHTAPTPRGGGLGFLLAFAAVALALRGLASEAARPDPLPLLLAAAPLAFTGWLDDKRGLSRRARSVVQFACAAALVAWLGAPQILTQFMPHAAALILCVVAAVAVINFTNFMDGMDGLVAGVSVVILLFAGAAFAAPLWWGLAGAVAGFLFFNWHPARIFMGDVGSTALGLFLCAAFLAPAAGPDFSWPMLAVGLPLFGDALYTLARRALRRENVLDAHHSHVYQRLMRSGLGHDAVALRYIGLSAACGLLGLAGPLGAVAALSACLASLVAAELRCARADVPFTKS